MASGHGKIFPGLRAAICTSGTIPAGYVTEFSWFVGVASVCPLRDHSRPVDVAWFTRHGPGVGCLAFVDNLYGTLWCAIGGVGVRASSVSWGRGALRFLGVAFPPASFVPAFSFDVDDEERAVDGCALDSGWSLWCAGLGFFILRRRCSCLFSSVTRGGSHGCFGTVWCRSHP